MCKNSRGVLAIYGGDVAADAAKANRKIGVGIVKILSYTKSHR
jgi:hypothetical protein